MSTHEPQLAFGLIGTRENQLDGKGRLTIPMPFRKDAPEVWTTVYLVPGLDPAERFVALYTAEQWRQVYERVQALPKPADRQAMMRGFVNRAVDVKPDGQGRFVLPASLREYAGVGLDVCWVAQDDHLELWSKERYEGNAEAQRLSAYHVWMDNQDRFGR